MKTPQSSSPELAAALGLNGEVWLKREDLHHFGSHKGRSIPTMIDHYWHKEKITRFVISSSGNAALAAAQYVQHHNENNPEAPITLNIFVGEKIKDEKLKMLQEAIDPHITIQKIKNPKQAAFQLEKKGGAKLLRQSTDDLALQGYVELAKELDHIPNLQAIFIPTSSGTTAQGIGEAFSKLSQKPQIHIVQTTAVHPITDAFQDALCPTHAETPKELTTSLAGAIVDRVAHRKFPVIRIVYDSKGSGWVVSNEEIKSAMELVKKTTGISISPNSALSVAGLIQAIQNEKKWDGAVVCLITGA